MPSKRKKPPKWCVERYAYSPRRSKKNYVALSVSELQKLTEDDDEDGYEYWKEQIQKGGQLVFKRPGKIEFENENDHNLRRRRRSRRSRSRYNNSSVPSSRSPSRIRNISEMSNCPTSLMSNDTRNQLPDEFSDESPPLDNNRYASNQVPSECRFPKDCVYDKNKANQRGYSKQRSKTPQFDSSYPEDSQKQNNVLTPVQQPINNHMQLPNVVYPVEMNNQFFNNNLHPNAAQNPNNNQFINGNLRPNAPPSYNRIPTNNQFQYPNNNQYPVNNQYPNSNQFPSNSTQLNNQTFETQSTSNAANSMLTASQFVCNYPKGGSRVAPRRVRKKKPNRQSSVTSDTQERRLGDKVFVDNYPPKGKTEEDNLESSGSESGQDDDSSLFIERGTIKSKQLSPEVSEEEPEQDEIVPPDDELVPPDIGQKTPRRRSRQTSILRQGKTHASRSRSSRGSSRARSVETAYESVVDDESMNDRSRKIVTFDKLPAYGEDLTLSKRFKQCFGVANVATTNKLYWCLMLGVLLMVLWVRVLLRYKQKTEGSMAFQVIAYSIYYINVTAVLFNLYEKIMTLIECECMKLPHWPFHVFTLLGGTPGNTFSLLLFSARDRSIAYQNKLILLVCLHLVILWYGYRRVLKL